MPSPATVQKFEPVPAPGGRLGLDALISDRCWIAQDATLVEAVEAFHAAPDLRLLAVLDDARRPIGAIRERDMRELLFNPFGYALLRNPTFGAALERYVRACPAIEIDSPIEAMVEAHARDRSACEGVIATENGRFVGVIGDATLLRLAAQRQVEAAEQRWQRAERVAQASAAFERDGGRLASDLAELSSDLASAAREMIDRAANSGTSSAAVAAAASQASANMDAIAERARALAETLQRVEVRSGAASAAAREVVAVAAEGGTSVRSLSAAAKEIGAVTELIDAIARKTTMLAINAAIESARAGEAGRGFTVVAHEVKALSAQTRTAAGTIRERVRHIRVAIEDVSAGYEGLETVVHAAESVSASIFEAMQEQRFATEAIARNLSEAGRANEEIGTSAARIRGTATAVTDAAERVLHLATGLAERGSRMDRRVGEFLEVVRGS